MSSSDFWRRILQTAVLALIVPAIGRANAGTGLLLPGLLHVTIGNLLIGWLETVFIRKVFKIPIGYGYVILANYVSSIAGFILLGFADFGMYPGDRYLLPVLLLMFCASVFIEWPFFAKSAKKQAGAMERITLKHMVSANVASYVFLIGGSMLLLTLTEGPTLSQNKDAVIVDLTNISANAYQYKIRPASMGGGDGCYTGYVIPAGLAANENGTYRIVSSDCMTITVEATSIMYLGTATAVVDSSGRRRELTFGGDFQ